MAEAGAAGLAGVTALLCVEAIDAQAGERVVVVGANGGVGAFVVQLLVARGATVIAPGLDIDGNFLRGLGAAEAPERGARPEADAVIDLVGGEPWAERFASPLGDLRDVRPRRGGAARRADRRAFAARADLRGVLLGADTGRAVRAR